MIRSVNQIEWWSCIHFNGFQFFQLSFSKGFLGCHYKVILLCPLPFALRRSKSKNLLQALDSMLRSGRRFVRDPSIHQSYRFLLVPMFIRKHHLIWLVKMIFLNTLKINNLFGKILWVISWVLIYIFNYFFHFLLIN